MVLCKLQSGARKKKSGKKNTPTLAMESSAAGGGEMRTAIAVIEDKKGMGKIRYAEGHRRQKGKLKKDYLKLLK